MDIVHLLIDINCYFYFTLLFMIKSWTQFIPWHVATENFIQESLIWERKSERSICDYFRLSKISALVTELVFGLTVCQIVCLDEAKTRHLTNNTFVALPYNYKLIFFIYIFWVPGILLLTLLIHGFKLFSLNRKKVILFT